MGYLVCNKCGGYYELKDGESPDDFDLTCECGGTLEYVDELKNELTPNRRKNLSNIKYLIPGLLIGQSALNICAISYNLTFIIVLGIIGVLFGVIFLLIRIMDLEKTLDLRYRRIIYFLTALFLIVESFGLVVIWPYVSIYSRAKLGIPFIIICGIFAFLIMILKTVNPEEFDKRFSEVLNSKER
ncbi:hypothetical protein [uncultured Methanobacterium sp.]|uniref:hypothetical protein n=1 Tax=uncultured Methanobacterium sp. TaxID=176306 RepID=UPI002AA62BA4|nr:hypothetical protein [uncultured Methanobacterium sp.]